MDQAGEGNKNLTCARMEFLSRHHGADAAGGSGAVGGRRHEPAKQGNEEYGNRYVRGRQGGVGQLGKP